ncbi:MAG: sensor histidine kinase [Chloroflexota bacterium]
MSNDDVYHIRPAGRHILTIGSDLIQDQYAAVVELVKNAYDADSPDVEIVFKVSPNSDNFWITIADRGHGMSRDTVINKWLVPSTDDKLNRKVSPNGRVMQGRKGIGRYAASLLGDNLFLKTVTEEGEKTEAIIEWNDFIEAKFLDDVEVLVTTEPSSEPSGTTLIISGKKEHLMEWDDPQIKKLKFELRKLIPPYNTEVFPELQENDFSIVLTFVNFPKPGSSRRTEKIIPYPIIQLYDYKISGSIRKNGTGLLKYTNQRAQNTAEDLIKIDLNGPTGCGELIFDIRVYDREADAIDGLIKRGLRNEQGEYLGKLQARQLLNDYNGISVYRNGFRIRPMGDPDYDWLKLNMKRIQNPSLKIGSNQIIGFVLIQSEELSNLIEKSARDGLRENRAYKRLIEITEIVIQNLENRRYQYRQKSGLSRPALRIERELEKLFAFDDLKRDIRSRLTKAGISRETADDVIKLVVKKEKLSNTIAENIRQTVAIYQGQATLGKIINVVLHEGRRPLNFFKNQIPNLDFWARKLEENRDISFLNKILAITGELGNNANLLVSLFARLDPLAAGKRGPKVEYNLYDAITGSFKVFENEFIENSINFQIDCPKKMKLSGWRQDIYVIMSNLIDNSIYWMVNRNSPTKTIDVVVSETNGRLDYIDYRDTGPGIDAQLIESEVIFEPEFSTKPEGTGLGLAIAGEAASRNELELKAFTSDTGAYFRLQPKEESNNVT